MVQLQQKLIQKPARSLQEVETVVSAIQEAELPIMGSYRDKLKEKM